MNAFERELEDTIAERLKADPDHKPPLFVATRNQPQEAKPQMSSVEEFVKKSASLYNGQRKMLLDLEAVYDAERNKITDDYRRRIDDLKHEAVEAIRACDIKHTKAIGEAKQILHALGRMNGD